MARDQIHTSTDNDQDHITKPVTGTQSGSKRYLDVAELNSTAILADLTSIIAQNVTIIAQDAQRAAQQILDTLLNGTLPRSVYNDVSLSLSGTDYTYTFKYNSVRQFTILISDPAGNYTTTLTEINNLLDETSSDVILLEDSSELLLEG